jgi:hypothetical protein
MNFLARTLTQAGEKSIFRRTPKPNYRPKEKAVPGKTGNGVKSK